MAIAAVSGVWLLAQILSIDSDPLNVVLAVLSLPAAVMAAGYTAFLFAQAEGRDLWQSRWLFPHLIAQALMAGAGAVAALVAVGRRTGAAGRAGGPCAGRRDGRAGRAESRRAARSPRHARAPPGVPRSSPRAGTPGSTGV